MHKKSCRVNYLSSILIFLISLMPVLFISTSVSAETEDKKQKLNTVGWLESVILEPWNIKLRAKLDTGAKTSSLHAVDIKRFERDGKEWVRFCTTDPEDQKVLKPMEAPLVRDVKIKRHNQKAQLRPVVEMTFCLDGEIYKSEFSLTDRSRFNYHVLLGRSMLQQGILVDPSVTFTSEINRKSCKKSLAENKEKQSKRISDQKENLENKS